MMGLSAAVKSYRTQPGLILTSFFAPSWFLANSLALWTKELIPNSSFADLQKPIWFCFLLDQTTRLLQMNSRLLYLDASDIEARLLWISRTISGGRPHKRNCTHIFLWWGHMSRHFHGSLTRHDPNKVCNGWISVPVRIYIISRSIF